MRELNATEIDAVSGATYYRKSYSSSTSRKVSFFAAIFRRVYSQSKSVHPSTSHAPKSGHHPAPKHSHTRKCWWSSKNYW